MTTVSRHREPSAKGQVSELQQPSPQATDPAHYWETKKA